MHTPSTDSFGPVDETNDENIEVEDVGEEQEEEPEEEEEKKEDTSSSEEEEKPEVADEPDPWRPLRQKVGEDIKETYLKEVQQILDRGKSNTMPKMPLSMSYYL